MVLKDPIYPRQTRNLTTGKEENLPIRSGKTIVALGIMFQVRCCICPLRPFVVGGEANENKRRTVAHRDARRAGKMSSFGNDGTSCTAFRCSSFT